MALLSKIIQDEHMKRVLAEFTRLGDQCYLENAGSSLYPQILLQQVTADLMTNLYMNPHSNDYTRDLIEQIRCSVLRFFNTDSSKYTVIFTSGTTQSLKLIVESFQFASENPKSQNSGSFVYLQDNHTSVLGMREVASEKYADIVHISHNEFLEAVESTVFSDTSSVSVNKGNSLFVYPAQSNFNGYKYPINCVNKLKNGCLNKYLKRHLCTASSKWYVLMDAASYISSNKLDLSTYQPDFVCLSFYKLFGYPTGLGAVLVKNTSADVLSQKKYFGGGTVDVVLSGEDYHVKRKMIHERFEDGTLPFLSILALKHGFHVLNDLIPTVIGDHIMDTIGQHTFHLAKDLYNQLYELRHQNGKKAVIFYMDANFTDIRKQGPIITFNLVREDGSHIGYSEFQHMADLFNISLRTGCFCNSGSCQRHLKVSNHDIRAMYKAGHKCGDSVDLINGKPTGAVRVSFGYYNTYNDVDKLMVMICRCFVKSELKKPIRTWIQTIFESKDINENNNDKKINKFNEHTGRRRILNEQKIYENVMLQQEYGIKSEIVLKEMAIFPVKSCGAFKVGADWKIGNKGFEYDREWMVVKDNGTCLTQKHNTRMCLVKPRIDLKQKLLILNCKGMEPIAISLSQSSSKQTNATFCQSKICTDIISGYDCGDEIADWISNALEESFLRLVRQSDQDQRELKKNNGNKKLLSLSNQAQYLLVNRATVRWLAGKIEDASFVDSLEELTDRFRGNIIIDMDQELAERDWHRVIIGKHEFRVEGVCSRCQMVCINQKTGEKTAEPLRTIAEQFQGKLRFGIYLSYVDTIDGSKDRVLKADSAIKSFDNDDNISR